MSKNLTTNSSLHFFSRMETLRQDILLAAKDRLKTALSAAGLGTTLVIDGNPLTARGRRYDRIALRGGTIVLEAGDDAVCSEHFLDMAEAYDLLRTIEEATRSLSVDRTAKI